MAKTSRNVSLAQLTLNGAHKYPWHNISHGQATFSSSYGTCYFEGRTFRKVKGGKANGNFVCDEDGEVYRIWLKKT